MTLFLVAECKKALNNIMGHEMINRLISSFFLFVFLTSIFVSPALSAEESVCAIVKIEILQELTIERQAFDAKMKITNSLDSMSLDNIKVDVLFTDEEGMPVVATSNPNEEGADFFIKLDDKSTTGISAVDGSQSISPSSVAEIHWLIIPAPGSGGEVPSGKLYFVGANLSYDLAGDHKEMKVSPDAIYVKPMPMLDLDYFLTEDVIADDPFTTEIVEAPTPYTLGVRIKNIGNGPAHKIKIDSAQPRILPDSEGGNEQGLLVDFKIISSYVDDEPAEPTLLIDFGDIDVDSAKVGRWVMESSLSGKFTEFKASFTHADELGGNLTSLIDENIQAHLLIRDVRLDLPGRDSIKDFLSKKKGEDVIRLFESDGAESVVVDVSDLAALSYTGATGGDYIYDLAIQQSDIPFYIKLDDPFSGTKSIKSVIRSDGKVILNDNVWLSKTSDKGNWSYFFNLFDAKSTGNYTVIFSDIVAQPHAPVIQFIKQQMVQEGSQLGFVVNASDVDGEIPVLTVNNLPVGAQFVDQNNGKGYFDWTPTIGQKGTYEVEFVASDGIHTTKRTVMIQVNSVDDIDGDGIADSWENEYLDGLDKDGSEDTDGDGFTDYEEYLLGTDPDEPNGTDAPKIFSPSDKSEITELKPSLIVKNSPKVGDSFQTYSFKIYSDSSRTNLIASIPNVVEGSSGYTSWQVPEELADNAWYYWESNVYTQTVYSQNAYGKFFVNTQNDAPGAFSLSQPLSGATIDIVRPELSITNSVDIDEDAITYKFEVYSDSELTQLIASSHVDSGSDGSTTWKVDVNLVEGHEYFWRVIAIDEHGLETISESVNSFTVNYLNVAPEAPGIISPVDYAEVTTTVVDLTTTVAVDLNEDPLSYKYQVDTVETFDSENLIDSDFVSIGDNDPVVWRTPELQDNTKYYWRVKAFDEEMAESSWVTSQFFVNSVNDAPTIPTIKSPTNDSWVEVRNPNFEIFPSSDIDNDEISYEFEVYADEQMEHSVKSGNSPSTIWEMGTDVPDNYWYYWRARSVDEHGEASEWTSLNMFFVNEDGIDDEPTIGLLEPSQITKPDENNNIKLIWEDHDPDSSALISLYLDTDNEGYDGTLLISDISEDLDDDSDQYLLNMNGISSGIYYIYAVISDGNSENRSYAQGAVVIGDIVITMDNLHAGNTRKGQWVSSQLNAGYLDQNYEYHASAYTSSTDGTVIDSDDDLFDAIGFWQTIDCSAFGCFWHAPNQPALGGIIADDLDPNTESTGTWYNSYSLMGQHGASYKYALAGDAGNTFGWNIAVSNPGEYKVYAKWTSLTTRPVDAKYTIYASGGAVDVTVNQQIKGGTWQLLGTYQFDDLAKISVSQHATGVVAADAVQIVSADEEPNRGTWDLSSLETGKYMVYSQWTAFAQSAMDATYQVTHANGTSQVEVDQRKRSNRWNLLGIYDFSGQTGESVKLTDEASGYVVAHKILAVPYDEQAAGFTWTPQLPIKGTYKVYARWVASYMYADDAKYVVNNDGELDVFVANQQLNDGQWVEIGTYDFDPEKTSNIKLLTSSSLLNSYVIADGVKFEFVVPEQQ